MMLAAAHVSIRLAAIVAAALFFGGAFSMLGSITLNHKPDRTKFAPAPEPFIAYPLPPLHFPFVISKLDRGVYLSSWMGPSYEEIHCPNLQKSGTTPIWQMAIDSKLTCFTRGSTLYFRGTISAGDASVVAIDIMISRVVIGAAGFAMLALGLWSSLAQTWRGHLVAWALTTGVAGVALLIIALMGVLTPIRVISIGQTDGYRTTVRYDYATFRSLAKRGLNEDVATYLIRLNDAIDGAVAHTTPSSGRFEPGFLDNPIIQILADVKPAFRDFIFWDPYRTVERGIGLCGHVSSVFVGIAREQGIDARIVTLNGHVVATAEVAPGYWHIFDPDLGVHIAASLKTAEQNKLLLLDRYNAAPGWGSLLSAQREAVIATYLTPEDNHIDSLGRESYHSGWRIWGLHHSEVERLANVAKWALPLSMVAQASLLWLLLMKLTRRSSNGSKSQ